MTTPLTQAMPHPAISLAASPDISTCPYGKVPPEAKWRAAMGTRAVADIRPFVTAPFRLSRTDRLASAGSCFAQRIAQALQTEGYSYLVTEPGPAFLGPDERHALNYGSYSARFGNVYTALQLTQLLARAFGSFVPEEPAWTLADGRVADPFRPAVQPGGFSSVREMERDRAQHLACVRQMFSELDVFIFTLGLTETWQARADGAAFPVAPGCGLGGRFDPARHAFENATVAQVSAQLETFVEALAKVNPAARIILTVSPVPLAATFSGQHVLLASTYSKSVLRVACEAITQRHAHVAYFGSYEIVTATGDSQNYFMPDRRAVSAQAVAHVIACFREQFLDGEALSGSDSGHGETEAASPAAPPSVLPEAGPLKVPALAAAREPDGRKPMCDEDEIMAALARHGGT